MEINARIYAVANDRELLEETEITLSSMAGYIYPVIQEMEPCAILPLSRTWFYFTASAEPTFEADEWEDCITDCATQLGSNGAVLIQFNSPDDPDEYQEYAYTTPNGSGRTGQSYSLRAYANKKGQNDIDLVISELLSERTASQRRILSWRMKKREEQRASYGDFRIVNGILQRYLANETEVFIPEGVKEIGEFAFVDKRGYEDMVLECEDYEAPCLETLVIPEGVTKINDYAFAYCTNLKSVTFPESIEFIGYRAFEGCEELEDIQLPARLSKIADYAFSDCSSLMSVILPETLTEIGEGAFNGCMELKGINIPENVTSIGEEAFLYCSELERIQIKANISEIGKGTFSNCSSLHDIQFPKNLISIGKQAFEHCTGLKKINLPPAIETIGSSAFKNNRSLEEIMLPQSLRSIGANAFQGCTALKRINIPQNVQEIGTNAFLDCPKLRGKEIVPGTEIDL